MRMITLPGCFWLRLAVEFRAGIKRKLILSPIALAEMSLPDLFAMLQSHVLLIVERRATLIVRDDTMILMSLFRDGCCSHPGHALTVNSTADIPPHPQPLTGCLWRKGVGFPPRCLPCQEFPPEHFTHLFPPHFILVRFFSLLPEPCGLAHFPHSF